MKKPRMVSKDERPHEWSEAPAISVIPAEDPIYGSETTLNSLAPAKLADLKN